MRNVPRITYRSNIPNAAPQSARAKAILRWFGECPTVTFMALVALHPRYPVVQGGGVRAL